MTLAWARDGMVLDGERRNMSQTARFQETLRSLAMIDEGFVKSEAGLALGAGGTSALTPKTAAPDMAIALGYDVAAALEELDQIVLRVSALERRFQLPEPAALPHSHRWGTA